MLMNDINNEVNKKNADTIDLLIGVPHAENTPMPDGEYKDILLLEKNCTRFVVLSVVPQSNGTKLAMHSNIDRKDLETFKKLLALFVGNVKQMTIEATKNKIILPGMETFRQLKNRRN